MKSTGLILTISLIMSSCSCRTADPRDFTDVETGLIRSSENVMRVLTVEDSLDLAVLRTSAADLSARALLSEDYARLCSLMVATVTHPSQDGVGIAAPQVGLSRRVVAVQRFDRAGEPFEVYPNISIIRASDSLVCGPEGCLSVPGRQGDVMRSEEIVIEYADLHELAAIGRLAREIPMRRDTVRGFTAVIFQHETDHLDGILYTDRMLQSVLDPTE